MSSDHAGLSKRFKPLYWAAFLQGVIFWYSIEKLFMKSSGFDAKTIALAIIILNVVNIFANIPIGILADRWSRTGILVMASLAMALASLLGGLSHGFWLYIVSACFSGLFMASFQGTYDSIVYDTLIEESVESKSFNRYYSRLRFYDGLALISGSLLSAFIVHFISVRATYFLTIPFALLAIVALLIFKEPKEHKKEERTALLSHVGTILKAVFHNSQVLWIGLNLVLISIVSALILDFDQLWFIALALPLFLYGPFDGILLSSFSVGGFLSERFAPKKVLLITGILSLLSAFALMTHEVYVIVIAQTVIVTTMVIYGITFEGHLHDNVASKIRVGTASIISTIGRIILLPVVYLVGHISDQNSIFHVSWLLVILLCIILITSTKTVFFRDKVAKVSTTS
jgi:MFS family permease